MTADSESVCVMRYCTEVVNAVQRSACAILCSAAMDSGHKMHNVK